MSHEHNECSHDLSFCKQCDVAYRKNCSKEWGVGISYVPRWDYWPGVTFPPLTYPFSSGSTGDPIGINEITSHAH